ncbi:hypothetical protein CVT26_008976 [Gymnopilus dilepis]|uniref:Uncharacterized protein n=1 Tax=Gymnopilus dilepis TaxID=231916 RepID=A0A409YIQ8_9AGAR|nr:hypothetical protein CVT26_008976 [Gymnopilus dilepis]
MCKRLRPACVTYGQAGKQVSPSILLEHSSKVRPNPSYSVPRGIPTANIERTSKIRSCEKEAHAYGYTKDRKSKWNARERGKRVYYPQRLGTRLYTRTVREWEDFRVIVSRLSNSSTGDVKHVVKGCFK